MNLVNINGKNANFAIFKKEDKKADAKKETPNKINGKKIMIAMAGLATIGVAAIAIKNKGNISNLIKQNKSKVNDNEIIEGIRQGIFDSEKIKKAGAALGAGALAIAGVSAINEDNNPEELPPIDHSNLGVAQKEKAATLGEPIAKSIIEDAVALNEVEYIYLKEIIEDEYFRFHEMGDYEVDYGEDGVCKDTDAYHKAQGLHELEDGMFNGLEVYTNDKSVFRGALETGNIVERIGANVKPDAKLIEELDTLLKTGSYVDSKGKTVELKNMTNFRYKTPVYTLDWAKRQDPVMFYFDENINKETYEALKDITERYARGTVTGAPEESAWLGPVAKNPTQEEIAKLAEQLRQYSPKIADNLEAKFQKQNGKLSIGCLVAHKNILKYFIEAESKVDKKGAIEKRLKEMENENADFYSTYIKGSIDEDLLNVYKNMSSATLSALSDSFIQATIVEDGIAESKTTLMKRLSGLERKFSAYGIRKICAEEGGEKKLLYYVLDEHPDIVSETPSDSFLEDIRISRENNRIKRENLAWLKRTAKVF